MWWFYRMTRNGIFNFLWICLRIFCSNYDFEVPIRVSMLNKLCINAFAYSCTELTCYWQAIGPLKGLRTTNHLSAYMVPCVRFPYTPSLRLNVKCIASTWLVSWSYNFNYSFTVIHGYCHSTPKTILMPSMSITVSGVTNIDKNQL